MTFYDQNIYLVKHVRLHWYSWRWNYCFWNGSKIFSSRDIRLIFFFRLNHIFLLPLSHFWCSATVRKGSKNGKNRKEIKWLLIALPKIFRVGRTFSFSEIFLIFFFKIFSIKCSFRIFNWCFSLLGARHQKTDPKSRKWIPNPKKRH